MQSGDYGPVENSMVEKYRTECNQLWPQANIFQTNPPPSYPSVSSPPPPPYSSCDIETNGGNSGVAGYDQN